MATVLITGSSSGFGRLTTEDLLQAGHTVFATMRDPKGRNAGIADELQRYAADTDGHLHIIELDVTSDASVEAAVNEALSIHEIDALVNNAGAGTGGITEGFTADQFQKLLELNVTGVHRVTRAVLPSMRKNGKGLIVNISSTMGRIVIPFASLYTASKFALEGYSESLRYELKGSGIDVTIVEPGGFGTNFLGNMIFPGDNARVESYGEYAKAPEQLWSGVGEMLSGENAPDPKDVARVVSTLVNAPAGKREARVVVDPMTGGGGAITINDTTTGVQKELLTAFGMEQMI